MKSKQEWNVVISLKRVGRSRGEVRNEDINHFLSQENGVTRLSYFVFIYRPSIMVSENIP
jgi:hypothetical protein